MNMDQPYEYDDYPPTTSSTQQQQIQLLPTNKISSVTATTTTTSSNSSNATINATGVTTTSNKDDYYNDISTESIIQMKKKKNVIEIPNETTTTTTTTGGSSNNSNSNSRSQQLRTTRFARGAFGEISIGLYYCHSDDDDNTDSNSNNDTSITTSPDTTDTNKSPTTTSKRNESNNNDNNNSNNHKKKLKRVRFVAIKTIPIPKQNIQNNNNEMNALIQLQSHINIVSLIGIYTNNPKNTEMKIVTEYCPIDLYMALEYKKKKQKQTSSVSNIVLSLSSIQCIMYDILNALQYIHIHHHLVHNDITPSNCLLSSKTGCIKICDFGLIQPQQTSSPSSTTTTTSTTDEGTRTTTINDSNNDGDNYYHNQNISRNHTVVGMIPIKYRSPEVLLGLQNIYEPSMDIYAASIIMGELLSFPYTQFFPPLRTNNNGKAYATNEIEQLQFIFQLLGTPGYNHHWDEYKLLPHGKHLQFTTIYPIQDVRNYIPICNEQPVVCDLFQHLFVLNPKQRYTAQQALYHEWFTKLRNSNNTDESCYQYHCRRMLVNELLPKQLIEPFLIPVENCYHDCTAVMKEQAYDVALKRRSLLSN